MRSRLEYLARLGVDALWVNPWYRSPLLDGGYDVADYREINEQFGTTDEAVEFMAAARAHGIGVIVDLVPNHTSWEHRWFVEALAAPPGSPARARYHFLPGRGADGELPPTDWQSVFGGPAWKRVGDGEWYLHLFDESQPDLNWDHAEVLAEFDDILRFWLDRGADGFRVDVAHSLAKDPDYPDLGQQAADDSQIRDRGDDHPFWDRDEIHPIIRRWRRVLDEYDDRMMVAEAWVRTDRRSRYVRPDEYHQAFDFDLVEAPWSAPEFASAISDAWRTATAVGSHPTWVLSNHDVVRHATRYGLPRDVDLETWSLAGPHDALDAEQGDRRARAAALITLALPGSVYLYQGEELGLPEVWDLPVEVLDDPIWEDSGHTRKGRDGCRVPLPWQPTGPSLGFGNGEPWLPQPARFTALAASTQDTDDTSMLHLYRRAITLRRQELAADDFEMLDLADGVLAFRRGNAMVCVVNMGAASVACPEGEVLLSSDPAGMSDATTLPPDTAVWLRESVSVDATEG